MYIEIYIIQYVLYNIKLAKSKQKFSIKILYKGDVDMLKNDFVEREMSQRPGTEGTPKMITILDAQTMKDKGRLFAKITLQPGEKLGEHKHEGEWEAFYCISGNGAVTVDGVVEDLAPGALSFTPSGGTHSIANTGDEPFVIMALILNE